MQDERIFETAFIPNVYTVWTNKTVEKIGHTDVSKYLFWSNTW